MENNSRYWTYKYRRNHFPVNITTLKHSKNSPHLDFYIWLNITVDTNVQLILSPTFEFNKNKYLKYGIVIDN